MRFESPKCVKKCICGRGSAPDLAGGAYSAPQTSYLDLGEDMGREGEGRGGNGGASAVPPDKFLLCLFAGRMNYMSACVMNC